MRKRQYGKIRTPRKIILVICEGETEAAYVELLRRHYKLPITIKSKIIGNKINRRLIGQILSQEGLNGNEDTRIIYMYDYDVESVCDKLRQLEGTLVVSNPCIELWYLLHIQNYSRCSSSKEVINKLMYSSPVWEGYVKGSLTTGQKELLLENRNLAIGRAKLLNEPTNPSTTIYLFLEILDSIKMAETTQKSPSDAKNR